MAPKGKKGKKKSSLKKKSSGTILSAPLSQAADFPKQLEDWRIRNIIWGSHGVSKSWKLPSNRCNGNNNIIPRLQLSSDIHEEKTLRNFQPQSYNYNNNNNISNNHFLNIPFLPLGFYTSKSSYKLSAWTQDGPCLDWWYDTRYLALNASSDLVLNSNHVYVPPGGIMLLTGISSPSLLFLRPQPLPDSPIPIERLDLKLVDPYDPEQECLVFTNAIGFDGKFYALSLHGALAVVEEVNSRFTITGMGKNRAVPSVPSRRFIEYLIESDGEILLVFLVSRKSIPMIDYVEVVKLDLITMSWEKMDNLGDRALFLAGTADRGMSVSANQVTYKSNQVGYKKNHIYFTHQGINCWKEFDLASKNIVSTCCNF